MEGFVTYFGLQYFIFFVYFILCIIILNYNQINCLLFFKTFI